MHKHSIARAMAGARWNPRDGLIGSDQGLWLDPSDITTMFQNSDGTTPVTAVEQPVGVIRDKSGRNNNALQSTDANRPTLSARYNLLTKTEQFDDAYWTKSNTTVSVTKVTDPKGTTAAQQVFETAITSVHFVANNLSTATTQASVQLKNSIYIKPNGRTKGVFSCVKFGDGYDGWNIYFNISDKSYTVVLNSTGTHVSTSITGPDAQGFYLIESIGTVGAFTNPFMYLQTQNDDSADSYPGDITKGFIIWGASLVPANQSSLPYQRVNTATDYDSDATKFPRRINYAAGQSMTVNFPANLGSSCVVARANPGINAVITENQTVNTPLTLNTSHSGLVITSRSISVDEKARLDEYLDKKAIAK